MKNQLFIFIALLSLAGCKKTYNCECKGPSGNVISVNEVVIKVKWGTKEYGKGAPCPTSWRAAGTPDTAICIIK